MEVGTAPRVLADFGSMVILGTWREAAHNCVPILRSSGRFISPLLANVVVSYMYGI